MNSKMLLDALGDISDEYVMSAQKYLTNEVLKITNSKAYQRTAPQKLLILAATIAAVMSLLVTAMAVNEDFREKVFEFFAVFIHIKESIQITLIGCIKMVTDIAAVFFFIEPLS